MKQNSARQITNTQKAGDAVRMVADGIKEARKKPEIVMPKRKTFDVLPELYGLKYKKSVYNFHFLKESQLDGMKYLNLAHHLWLPLFEIKKFKDENGLDLNGRRRLFEKIHHDTKEQHPANRNHDP